MKGGECGCCAGGTGHKQDIAQWVRMSRCGGECECALARIAQVKKET
jgi:hypothetical protein